LGFAGFEKRLINDQHVLSVCLKAHERVSDLDLFAIFRAILFSCLERSLKLLKQIEAFGLINKPHPLGCDKLELPLARHGQPRWVSKQYKTCSFSDP